ncbi:MAG: DUF1700 domain-containing protein [Anaeroplasma sp.]|nr:DUF1700 domain-containing protein [Anaeroplasma sp.]
MRKKTFLKELRNRLEKNKCKDVDDVIQYYDELIEDTIDRTNRSEDDVVYDLGPISEIVARVTNNRNPENNYFENDNKIHYDELDEANSSVNKNTKRKNYYSNKKSSNGFKILIGILTMPVWLALIIAYVGVIIGMVISAIALGASSVLCIIHGIALAGVGNKFFEIGVGVVLFGVTLFVIPLVIKIVTLLFKILIKIVKWLFGSSKGGRR